MSEVDKEFLLNDAAKELRQLIRLLNRTSGLPPITFLNEITPQHVTSRFNFFNSQLQHRILDVDIDKIEQEPTSKICPKVPPLPITVTSYFSRHEYCKCSTWSECADNPRTYQSICLVCGVCLGDGNTRQLCGKTFCYGV